MSFNQGILADEAFLESRGYHSTDVLFGHYEPVCAVPTQTRVAALLAAPQGRDCSLGTEPGTE